MELGRRVYISIPLGINVRDILRLGTLEAVLNINPPVEVVLLTPARLVEEFHQEFASPRVKIAPLARYYPTKTAGRLVALRRRLIKRHLGDHRLLDFLLRVEARTVRPRPELADLFRDAPPALVVSVHPQDWWDWELLGYARRLGIPTLGVLRSWDNIKIGMAVHPDFLAVWNEANMREAEELERYRTDRVRVVGAPPFDPYFDASVVRPRGEFLESLGLDPSQPLVVYAPAGRIWDYGDETSTLDDLLKMRHSADALRQLQIVCRLHPHSRLESYWSYRNKPGFALSFGSYVKTLGWSMTRPEVEEMANLLYHADAIVCGWTTVIMEAAVFDTPTVVAAYSTVQPEHVEGYLRGWTYNTYFREMVESDLIPVARSASELEAMLVRAITDPGWHAHERNALVRRYVPMRDGRTSQRIADWIGELIGRPVRSDGAQ